MAALLRSSHSSVLGFKASRLSWRCLASEAPSEAPKLSKGRKSTSRDASSQETSSGGKSSIEKEIEDRKKFVKDHSNNSAVGFSTSWKGLQGHQVPYRFRIQDVPQQSLKDRQEAKEASAEGKKASAVPPASKSLPYQDYAGLRFPTLETAENFDYHKDRGLNKLIERSYPIKVPAHRRLDPYLREYIYFLHNLDPVRFTVSRIAERYRLRDKTVAKVVKEWGAKMYITRSGLSSLKDKQKTREEVILSAKEHNYARWVGWDQLGDEDEADTDDEALGEFRGWRSTSDWVRRQTVEVEMMSAFPMMEKRDPMPKRVDVDMVIESKQNFKIVNWIDPADKVVF